MLGSSPLSNNIFATATNKSVESSDVVSGEEEAIKCNAVSPRSGVTIEIEAPRSSKNFATNPSPLNELKIITHSLNSLKTIILGHD